jgi:hypothetical protein
MLAADYMWDLPERNMAVSNRRVIRKCCPRYILGLPLTCKLQPQLT